MPISRYKAFKLAVMQVIPIDRKIKVIKKAFKIESIEEFDELVNTIEAALTKVEEEIVLEEELQDSQVKEEEAEDQQN